MLLRLLTKIWPSLIPITVYLIWVFIVEKIVIKKFLHRKKNYIEGEKVVGEKSTEEAVEEKVVGNFSMQNPCFVIILYMSLVLAILTLLVAAMSSYDPKKLSYPPPLSSISR